MSTLRVAFLSALVLELAAALATALVAVEVGLRLLAGHMSYQTALLVLLLTPEAYLPLRAVGVQFHASMEGVTAARGTNKCQPKRRRWSGGIPARHLAAAHARNRYRPGRRPPLHRHHPVLAETAGQTGEPMAAHHRHRPRQRAADGLRPHPPERIPGLGADHQPGRNRP